MILFLLLCTNKIGMDLMERDVKRADQTLEIPATVQHQGLWVFGYGSLMWNPGFYFEDQKVGRCAGVHRSFCVWSVYHRGTYQRPGLVLGLKSGGVCEGRLYYVPPSHVEETIFYLRKREQVTRVYREVFRRVDCIEGAGWFVRALTFIADRKHPQYAANIPIGKQAEIIKRAEGRSGYNLCYLATAVRHLADQNIKDQHLNRILVLTKSSHRLCKSGNLKYDQVS